jgi:hypothetical protein
MVLFSCGVEEKEYEGGMWVCGGGFEEGREGKEA